jgi:hypothetical protein
MYCNSALVKNNQKLQAKKLNYLILYFINEQMKIELRKINYPVKFQSSTFKLNNIIYNKKHFNSKRHKLLYALVKVQLLKKRVPMYIEYAKKNNLGIKFFYITHSKKIFVVYEKKN